MLAFFPHNVVFFFKYCTAFCVFYMRSLRDFVYIDVFLICAHCSRCVPYEKGNRAGFGWDTVSFLHKS